METQKSMAMTQTDTVPGVFHRTVETRPDQVALRHKELGLWRDISFKEYQVRAHEIGAALAELGLEAGDRAAIIGDNGIEWVMADLGIQCAGGVCVGIYATNAWEQVEYVVEHSDARFLFVENEEQLDKWLKFQNRVPRLERVILWDSRGLTRFTHPMVLTFDQLLERGRAALEKAPDLISQRSAALTPQDPCVIIYTSGTTGPPKGAVLTHGNVTWTAQAVAGTNPISHKDQVLSFLPLCHIFERLFSVFIHITYGYTVNFVEKPNTVTANMIEVSPTIGYAVPRIWEKYYSQVMIRMDDADFFKRSVFRWALNRGRQRARALMNGKAPTALEQLGFGLAHALVFRKLKERLGFDRMHTAYSGAAPISREVLAFFQALGLNLIEGYGQTEGTGVTTLSPHNRVRFGTVGQPLKGCEIAIAPDGEILVRSPGVFQGYHKSPDATAETLDQGWLATGDMGELTRDDYLKITDRKKDIIVTAGGKNISPQYIENQLKACIYINDAVIIGDRRKFVSALIMIDEDNVIKYAQDHKIQFSTYRDLARHEEIHHLIDGEIHRVNQGLARVENIRKFTILTKRLYEEDGEVTPTMKIKRNRIETAFSTEIEAMYH